MFTRYFRMYSTVCAIACLAVLIGGCDFLDATEVSNPRTTPEELADATEPTAALLPGMRAQFGRALNAVVVATAVGSDDYSSHRTGLGGNEMDFPRGIIPNTSLISSDETGSLGIYWHLQELRSLGDFIIDEISPNDETATSTQVSEARYFRGMAFLMQGENFVALPTAPDETPSLAGALLLRAAEDFATATNLDPSGEFGIRATAALARTHRALGNVAEAGQFAQAALDAGGTDFLFSRSYDNTSPDATLDNLPHAYLVSRSLQEMQPLPRLDFLDPKYAADDTPIATEKAEEMHLILAEVAMASGNYDTARNLMAQASDLTNTRPTFSLDDTDQRLNDDLNIRPRNAEIRVAADANSPFRSGLVLTRPAVLETPLVSGTSISADSLTNVPLSDELQLRRLLYTLRQEIMLLEGRRLQDLGIRFPMMLREIDTNPNITQGDVGTQVLVPDFIPPSNEMDQYGPISLYDANEALVVSDVTILHDMNLIIARDRGLVINNPLLP